MKARTMVIVGVAGAVLAAAGAVWAADPAPAKPATAKASPVVKSIIGEVVDPACWIVNGAKGEGHKECAIACAKAGQTLAILEKKTGKLYMAVGERPGEDPNKGLVDYVAQTVMVKGKVYSRGGALGIMIASVEPYKAP
jgi:hypothetical protein